MKRYWLFGGTFWDYASGGMADLIDCYDTEQEARAGSFTAWPYGNGNGYFTLEWFQIVDMELKEVVAASGQPLGSNGKALPVGAVIPRAKSFKLAG